MSEHGGDNGDQENSILPNNVEELTPIVLQPNLWGRSHSPPAEAIMPLSEVHSAWGAMFNSWNSTGATVNSLLTEQVLLYLAINGASPRANFKRVFRVQGRDYPSRVIYIVLGDRVRQFARANADLTRAVLKVNPDTSRMLANRAGFDSMFGDIAFDYSDYCTSLTSDERSMISSWKSTTIGTSGAYRRFRPEIAANVSSQGSGGTSTGGGQGSFPGDFPPY